MRDDTATPQDAPPVAGSHALEDYDTPLYVISVAADLAGMHPQTLRGYERKGLISPARSDGNTRRYSRRDVDRLRLIQTLTQDRGLNLAGVRAVLEMGEQLERARGRIAELEDMVRHLAQRLTDDVEAAHRSHRFEIVPSAGTQVEPHPRLRRRPLRRTPADRPTST